MIEKLLKGLLGLIILACSSVILLFAMLLFIIGVHDAHLAFVTMCQDMQDKRYKEIYNRLIAQTGQTQDRLPFEIVDSSVVNAYTDGKKVVMHRGMLNYLKNEHEIALVLGHEIAHQMLRHVRYKQFRATQTEISVAEANADKLGAVYMMKAGYDVCVGREIWRRMEKQKGNYQGYDHPAYVYRYAELNINCN